MDQLDFVVVSLLLIFPFATVTWLDIAVILSVSFFGDIAVTICRMRLAFATPNGKSVER
jgi:hypothetical protein